MALNGIGSATPVSGELGALDRAGSKAGGASFADALGQAIQQVDGLQQDADRQAADVARGGGNLHETALALEKADVALRVAAKVRNKLVEAYQEVMRMPV